MGPINPGLDPGVHLLVPHDTACRCPNKVLHDAAIGATDSGSGVQSVLTICHSARPSPGRASSCPVRMDGRLLGWGPTGRP
jgi:hypothetical protein